MNFADCTKKKDLVFSWDHCNRNGALDEHESVIVDEHLQKLQSYRGTIDGISTI